MCPQHLVTVWNPTYATNALEAHVRVLLDWARRQDVDPDDVYVWWGKVKSSQRQSAMPHFEAVVALSPDPDADLSPEVHLYLTDYRSLYVATVEKCNSPPCCGPGFGAKRHHPLARPISQRRVRGRAAATGAYSSRLITNPDAQKGCSRSRAPPTIFTFRARQRATHQKLTRIPALAKRRASF